MCTKYSVSCQCDLIFTTKRWHINETNKIIYYATLNIYLRIFPHPENRRREKGTCSLEWGESKLKFFLRGGVLSQGGKLHISGVGHLVYDLLLDAYVLLNQVNTKATPVNNAVPTRWIHVLGHSYSFMFPIFF